MKYINILKRMVQNSDRLVQNSDHLVQNSHRSVEKLEAMVEGLSNQSRIINDKLEALIQGSDNQSQLINNKFGATVAGLNSQMQLLQTMIRRQDTQIELHKAEIAAIRAALTGEEGDSSTIQVPPNPEQLSFEAAVARLPLMIDEKTYNTSHPDYDATLVRNFPGKIFNADKPCNNAVYAGLRPFAKGDHVPDAAWDRILKEVLEEARTVPHSDQVFERRTYIERYLEAIREKYEAHYAAGWVNLDDALFLYWLVRKLNPKIIVQTGVCNGLSSAFMMLGLAKNGPQGSLHAIDLPPVFNPNEPGWTVKGKVYGVVIPEGETSGWIVPDAYRNRFEVWNGDAKALLPKMIDQVEAVDLFYHDSDHTYDHMTFEFREAKRKLRPGGLVVGDDVSWNASVWDFADQYGVPSYNFKGAVGVAFF
jgi:predicted O-methyltransferase YrrM